MTLSKSSFILTLLLAVSGYARTNVGNIDSICLASILMEKPKNEIPAYLRYHNLLESETGSGDSCMSYTTHDNETIIIYGDSLPAGMTPIRIEILTDASDSEIAEKLNLCGFSKTEDEDSPKGGNSATYRKGSIYHLSRTICTVSKGHPAKITFTKRKGGI